MAADLVLAIDQGTTNTKAILVDNDGGIVARASAPNDVAYPRPGWAEQSPVAIWRGVETVIADVTAELDPNRIAGIAISNQRESVVVWDAETGTAVEPCIIWQCRRTADRCDALRRAGHTELVEDRTGLGLDPLFPATKIAWLLDNTPGARAKAEAGGMRAGTVDSWLLWNLTGGTVHATDHSNASRTQLFNTRTLSWDEELSTIFGVPSSVLPEVMSSDSLFGRLAEGATALPAGTPVHAMMGDSHAALFGHGVRAPGMVKATYGTGSSLMALTSERVRSAHGLSGTIAWSRGGTVNHALEGNISVSGQAAAFMAEMLGLDEVEALTDLAQTVPNTNGVAFVPALVGLGAPYWDDEARGIISGMTLGTKPAHLARAALEAIALQIRDVFMAMEADTGARMDRLLADGGATRNDLLMQIQADVLDRPVSRSGTEELSALGAALMTQQALGLRPRSSGNPATEFVPETTGSDRKTLLESWRNAVSQAMAVHATRSPR